MKKKSKTPLGKAIIKSVIKKNVQVPHDDMAIFFQKSQTNQEYIKSQKLKSIIEQNSLAQFLTQAQLSNKNFQAQRNLKMKDIRQQLVNKKIKQLDIIKQEQMYKVQMNGVLKKLRIPRRPNWTNTDTKNQYIKRENESFLDWRKKLAEVQQKEENVKLTPFQKNLQVWKQLWRVVQRAHILIQIVDARDPLFYRCQDLQIYVKEKGQNKRNILLINKSDLVSEQIRKIWNKYLLQNKVDHIFFSAKFQQIKIQLEEQVKTQSKQTKEEIKVQQTLYYNSYNIANSTTVIQIIKNLGLQIQNQLKNHPKPNQVNQSQNKQKNHFQLQVGMVGYPNVGKSSVINSLLNKKKVAVASQPGKTKHYQTLYLTPQIILCDCPGLVFPNVASTYAEMILNGVIPIDTLRQYYSPVTLLIKRVPRIVPQKKYGVKFSDNIYSAQKLLQNYAALKGFYTGRGLPNEAQASRFILKDYTNGHLIYCKLPPNYVGDNVWQSNPLESINVQNQQLNQNQQIKQTNEQIKVRLEQEQLDDNFFDKQTQKVLNNDQIFKEMSLEDILDLIQGKSLKGIKVNKQVRKQLKFAVKRGQTLQQIKKNYLLTKKVINFQHKQFIKV